MDTVRNRVAPVGNIPKLAHPGYAVKVPDNAGTCLLRLSDDENTLQLLTSEFANSVLPVLTRERNKTEPHHWMTVGPESHYSDNRGRMHLAIHVAPNGKKQIADSLVVWIHESKPGYVWVNKSAKVSKEFLAVESRRREAGEQLLERFCDRKLLNALILHEWKFLWGSSGAGVNWTVWIMKPDVGIIYQVFCPTANSVKLLPIMKNGRYTFSRRLWNVDVRSPALADLLGYAHKNIMGELNKLKVKPQHERDALNKKGDFTDELVVAPLPLPDRKHSETNFADLGNEEHLANADDQMDQDDDDFRSEDGDSRSSMEDDEDDEEAEADERQCGIFA
ncbi:uncharacterized protein LOC129587369 [Paramacrobiotus metropolitanus]|uniref:uncharacterized protein LOC129587369 n=1 Tax=Paramacrobiotus metropolitanus TaxID=2943436 RepID=UPI0024458DD2|nr:uncharacterized protein LOC129587369 [Paramacrobiotus metropolitanus]